MSAMIEVNVEGAPSPGAKCMTPEQNTFALVSEVWREMFAESYNLYQFYAALEARGLEIREKTYDNT